MARFKREQPHDCPDSSESRLPVAREPHFLVGMVNAPTG
jgi:hypothetical protein